MSEQGDTPVPDSRYGPHMGKDLTPDGGRSAGWDVNRETLDPVKLDLLNQTDKTFVMNAEQHRVYVDWKRRKGKPTLPPVSLEQWREGMAQQSAQPADVVPVVYDDRSKVIAFVARPNVPLHMCPSTLARDEGGMKKRLNAKGQSTLDFGRDGTLLMEVADVLAYWRESEPDEQGEIASYSWLVLIDTAGETFGTSSEVAASKIGEMLAMRSAGLIQWPAMIQIVKRTARKSGFVYHDLIVL